MSGKLIATIYFYLISAASLLLIVIGIFSILNFVINSTQYDKYPLRYSQPDCEAGYSYYPSKPAMPFGESEATPSAQELERQKSACMNQQEVDRKQHKVENLRDAVGFSLIGAVLFLIHFPLARKQSKS